MMTEKENEDVAVLKFHEADEFVNFKFTPQSDITAYDLACLFKEFNFQFSASKDRIESFSINVLRHLTVRE